ncbi:ubiquinol-cytochrome c reductase iron-sulfur subunit [Kangiella aquimarina]|uniref:Ubiquinol-cytochrome c reductase iron-sulfur subunit n=1 Tax=Kangiella aquimarina TaxID=261965 RepID=A0ABZ0X2B3_9GAMM|nr:ubiquinol-cytochrome c reductase iron-sulfur subunit [Kangiella aquimarina]WQG84447.1 ubiquinol-cytochrome c reductase iron-sulfur subunit [Kangiella aquimarina]
MNDINEPNENRRRFLIGATSFVAGAGLVGVATPFVQSWNPSTKARAVGAPVRVDVSKIESGTMITAEWQGKPVWVLRRTPQNLQSLDKPDHRDKLLDPDSEVNQQPEYAKKSYRSIRDDIFVAVGVCTHLGCVPNYEPEGMKGVEHALFFCPCHGSKFDLAGRVFKGVPAPTNLIIPPHQYLDNSILEIGADALQSNID